MVKNGKRSIVSQLAGRLNGLKKIEQADFKAGGGGGVGLEDMTYH